MTEQLGSLRAHDDRIALRFERTYDATPDEVWAALTEPESIGRWLFAEAVLEPRVGGAFRLRWSENEQAGGSVLAWEPPRLLEVEWDETDMRSVLRVEITATANGATLVLDHRNIAEQAAIGMGAGWHAHLEALGELLGGADTSSERWQPRYEMLRPRYEELARLLNEGAKR
jgi:uncharacterized protein YndB with AHSA1/START domain